MLSDPLVLFAGARIETLLELELAPDASVVAVESLAAGRVATGERWAAARCQTRVRVRRDGATVLDDALLLDPAHGDVPARMGPFDVWANVVLSGPRVARAVDELLGRDRPRHRLAAGVPAIELARRSRADACSGSPRPRRLSSRPGSGRRSRASLPCSVTIRSPGAGRRLMRCT